ncbi:MULTISPECIES: glucose-1-phosphate adenylyltransferase [Paraburkholderia]|uniref:Glucose-1-phosphate adenylyltransferase n=2 Tax=Paraburkholderia TaxID=1822464 RepID=A0A7Z0BBN9_9BURK|nr:glucose-1-phosphate adenylyltransferase [Paraburkholderia bryophila]NYH14608.1 glucose-1-phosphate adenylyltransferase [Paraburkholderia bryophila]NYH27065.1 glucose-1-phosphate adenylyltransferase [Paraburkholderia bryophila]
MMQQSVDNLASSRQLINRTVALVLAGGRGSRLHELTSHRVKPAVYFGGKFRIIDFVLSNCLNSGIRRIAVVTQYKSHSLLRHLQRGWSFLRGEMNEFIDLLPAQQRVNEEHWYRGTADAVYQNLDILRSYSPEYVLVLAGDHIYKMDYAQMLLDHVETGAGVTVGCIEVPKAEATAFGVMAVDSSRKVVDFIEKPADPPGMPGNSEVALASMGIYVFSATYLDSLLAEDLANPQSSHDFGKDIIPLAVRAGRAFAHPLGMSSVPAASRAAPYWRDVGTVDAFWKANLDLASTSPELNIYDRDWPIWTHQEQLPPAKFVHDTDGNHGVTFNTLISGGCIVSGSHVSNSVLFSSVRIHSFCAIDQAVILPQCDIGRNCRLSQVVIDRGCKVPAGTVIGEDAELDAKRFHRSASGVVLVTKDMLENR